MKNVVDLIAYAKRRKRLEKNIRIFNHCATIIIHASKIDEMRRNAV